MKEILRLVGVLTLISACSGLLLAFTNKVTLAPIEQAKRQETVMALRQVLPPFDNRPTEDVVTVTHATGEYSFYIARQNGQFTGAAFSTTSNKGYGGPIKLMVGVSADKTIRGIQVLSQQETPGLGTKITVPPFSQQFGGRAIETSKWAVRADGGDFDAITGATISSRAVMEAVGRGLDVYRENLPGIEKGGSDKKAGA